MRKYIILLITILLIGGNKLSAQENQKKDSEQFDTSKNTIIDLKNKRVYQNILLDKDYSFPLNPFPDTLIISYTGNDYLKRRIIFFNKGKKDSLIISWAGTGSNIENLKLSDFNQGKVALSFAGKALINIGNREKPIKPRSFLNWNTWIMVEPLPAKDDADNKTSDTFCKDSPVIQWVKPVDSAKLAKAIVCILCNSFPKCNDSSGCQTNPANTKYYQQPNDKKRKSSRNSKITEPTYICVYDVTGVVEWYQNFVSPTNRIRDISKIRPTAWSEMTFIIKGNQEDEDYFVTADGQTYFMNDSALQGTLTNNYGLAAESNSAGESDKESKAPTTDSITTQKIAVSLADSLGKVKYKELNFTINPSITSLNNPDSLIIITNKDKFPNQAKSFKKEFNSAINGFARSWINMKAIANATMATKESVEWKEKLMGLDKALQNFNLLYSNIDFREVDYSNDLGKIKEGIKNCLNIPATSNPDDLRKALGIILCSEVDDKYRKDARQLIESIVSEYKSAISKITTRKLYHKTIQVPDADDVKINITSKKSNSSILERSFHIRGGVKIDFSSGIFYNGLGTGDFILSKSNFRYFETTDSFFVSNGIQVDSVHYTGRVLDTTGNFIRKNSSRINYGAGFFIHVYKRSGHAIDFGGGIGFQINNSGQALLMVGFSPMIHVGSTRVAMIVGGTIGKRTYLSTSAKPFAYQSYYKGYDQAATNLGTSIFQNRNDLPRFYDSGTNLKADTYDKIGFGLFGGITFNFASFSLSKK